MELQITKIVGYGINLIGLSFIVIGFTESKSIANSFLFCVLGFLSFLISHFLFKRKKWAWRVSFLIVIVLTIIISGGGSLLLLLSLHPLNSPATTTDILGRCILLFFVILFPWLVVKFFRDRKNFFKIAE